MDDHPTYHCSTTLLSLDITAIRQKQEIVYEDTHYRVTIVYGFLATNTDFIRIDEVFGPFHREVYQSERYGIDTKKLNSTTAIEAFLKQQKQ